MAHLTVVPKQPSERVFLLLGRAVPIVDAWFRELRTSADMTALLGALSDNLDARRDALELAASERPPAA